MVTPTPVRTAAAAATPSRWLRIAFTPILLALVAICLVSAICGGLLRAGVRLPDAGDEVWLARAAGGHAALMICGFLGTVLGIERAVAVRLPAAFLAPLAAGLSGICLLLGRESVAAWLALGASLVFVLVNAVVVRRQRAPHTLLLLAAGLCWFAGNALFAAGQGSGTILPWWFAFLLMTIAAERLEMTRLTRRGPAAQGLLYGVLAAMAAGAALSAVSLLVGGVVYGASLLALAAWLGAFDIARRTLFAPGLSRYMAVCLLAGYAWLAVAGVAWAATAIGLPARDMALHALGLGFIFSMIMGHAPVILPAVARVKLRFGAWFYLPLAALHLSLMVRLFDGSLRGLGALLNAGAIALFIVTVAVSAIAHRHIGVSRPRPPAGQRPLRPGP